MMPRFFLDVGFDAEGRDEEGETFADLLAAKSAAKACMSEMLAIRSGYDPSFAVSVRNGEGRVVHRLEVRVSN